MRSQEEDRGDLTERSGQWQGNQGWNLTDGTRGSVSQGLVGVKQHSCLEQLLAYFRILEYVKV